MTRKKFLLRIDPELYTALERWAGERERQCHGQRNLRESLVS